MKISLNFPDTLLKKIDDYCEKYDYERSEFVRKVMRDVLEAGMPPLKVVGTPYVKIPENQKPITSTLPVENTPPDMSDIVEMEGDFLWEDYNLMPVYKVGVPDQYCVTWHTKGERRTVYPIRKIRPDGTLELEGKYCKECIDSFKSRDGHLE